MDTVDQCIASWSLDNYEYSETYLHFCFVRLLRLKFTPDIKRDSDVWPIEKRCWKSVSSLDHSRNWLIPSEMFHLYSSQSISKSGLLLLYLDWRGKIPTSRVKKHSRNDVCNILFSTLQPVFYGWNVGRFYF